MTPPEAVAFRVAIFVYKIATARECGYAAFSGNERHSVFAADSRFSSLPYAKKLFASVISACGYYWDGQANRRFVMAKCPSLSSARESAHKSIPFRSKSFAGADRFVRRGKVRSQHGHYTSITVNKLARARELLTQFSQEP